MFPLWTRRAQTALFWRWLAANRARLHRDLKALNDGGRDFSVTVIELSKRLRRVHPGLVHQIGMSDPDVAELIVSADGNRAVFPYVIDLVRNAPKLDGFKITAFRPRNPVLLMTMFERDFRDGDLAYRLYPDGDRLGIDLFVDADLDEMQLQTIGFMMLDQALGEFDVETGLGAINIEQGRPDDAKPFGHLAAEFDSRPKRTAH